MLFIILLILAESVLLGSLVYTDHGLWGLTSIIVALVAYNFLPNAVPLLSIWGNICAAPFTTLAYIGVYILLGIVWSFFKYYSYVREKKRDGVTRDDLAKRDHSGKIITWMAYWPISAVLHVIGDGLYKMFRWIYDYLHNVYIGILNKVYSN